MASDLGLLALYVGIVVVVAAPLGAYIARVLEGRVTWLRPVERAVYRMTGVDPDDGMNWRRYSTAILALNVLGIAAVYALQRLQGMLPLNPERLPAVKADLALNTAVSFATNTNWQNYGGETTLSYLTQALGLGVQNFLSAATGLAVLAALVRGMCRQRSADLGNAWADMTRCTLYVLLPLSVALSLFLVGQGVVQTLRPYRTVPLVRPTKTDDGHAVTRQRIPLGPAASQLAIKQLGTNGGGFFNTNSAHPLENPTPLANPVQCLAILLIPAAQCFAFGRMVKDRRQGRALFAACLALFVVFLVGTFASERAGNPMLSRAGLTTSANWEGKEVRFGIGASALWATATTAASNGSVNAMHDSFTPLGGLFPMALMQLGEVVFGGVGSGLCGLIAFVLVTVFVAGLMVGRTPEYLGKKIEAFEIKMVSLVVLIPCIGTLLCAAVVVAAGGAARDLANPGPHGFSELLYAYSSMANNNGSAFAGFVGNTVLNNVLGAVAMFAGRFWLIPPILALAGSLAGKTAAPVSAGTLPTHTPLFVILLCTVILVVGGLTFIPALALGPVAEHMRMVSGSVR